MKNLKRYLVVAAIVLFAGGAVYLNWDYNRSMGQADPAMVEAEDEAMAEAGVLEEGTEGTEAVSF